VTRPAKASDKQRRTEIVVENRRHWTDPTRGLEILIARVRRTNDS